VWFRQVQLHWSSSNRLSIYIKFQISLRYNIFLLPIFPILCIQNISQNVTEFCSIFFRSLRLSLIRAFNCNFGFLLWISDEYLFVWFIVPRLANIILWNVIWVALYVSCGYCLLCPLMWEEGTTMPSSYYDLSSFWKQKPW